MNFDGSIDNVVISEKCESAETIAVWYTKRAPIPIGVPVHGGAFFDASTGNLREWINGVEYLNGVIVRRR